ncbi:MAG: hemerythrin domain-containing protein [Bdellovibrionota bacterium]
MDAIELLKDDHENVKNLFDQVRTADGVDEKRELFEEIRDELLLHAHIEETIFYPVFQNRDGFQEIVKEAIEEHQEMKKLLREISDTEDDEEMESMLEDLIECVEHHVEEEETEFFPKVKKSLDQTEINELGSKLEQEKKKKPLAA